MRNFKLILPFFMLVALFSCEYQDSEWDMPSSNLPTGNYNYQSSTMYFQKNGNPDPEKPVENSGYISLRLYLNSADMQVIPELGWDYTVHLSTFTKYTLQDSTEVTAFSINPQEVVLNGYYYDIMGTNNKDLRNTDGSLIGYFDGYIKGDSLIYEFRSNDGFEGWTVADFKARIRD